MHGDDAFPNLENPLATGEQREVEERALRLVKRPEFEQARALSRTGGGTPLPIPRATRCRASTA